MLAASDLGEVPSLPYSVKTLAAPDLAAEQGEIGEVGEMCSDWYGVRCKASEKHESASKQENNGGRGSVQSEGVDDHENEARVTKVHVSGGHDDSRNQKDIAEPDDHTQIGVRGNRSEVGPTNGDNHVLFNHDVNDHAIEHHEFDRGSGGKIDQSDPRINGTGDHSKDQVKPMNGDNHALHNRDANDHVIEYHEIGRPNRGGTCPSGMGNKDTKGGLQEVEAVILWTAPRIILQYLERRTGTEEFCQWPFDDHDGALSWIECKQRPREEYKEDTELTTNQYHTMTIGLYQSENMTEDIINGRKWGSDKEQDRQTWQQIKEGIRKTCMTMYRETLDESSDDDVEEEKTRAQRKFKEDQQRESHDERQLAMFEKCRRHKQTRRGEDDDSSGDEESCNLVCNMTGAQWESLPFPIIVDSGACASVVPSGWCAHLPLRETQQSRAGEYFRAANGQKIHNQGERVVSMMTKDGNMRNMKFTACDVSNALGFVSQMCKAFQRVVFSPPWDPNGSYIQHIETGKRCGWRNRTAYMF